MVFNQHNQKFYKYRSLSGESSDFTLDILLNERLYFNSIYDFNDPFEFCFKFDSNVDDQTLLSYYTDNDLNPANRNINNIKGRIFHDDYIELSRKNTANKFGVCSLSKENLNILMWSMYADCHKGVCIEFTPKFEITSTSKIFFERVLYSKEYPSFDFQSNKNGKVSPMFYTKYHHFSYESEYRMFNSDPRTSESFSEYFDITGIFLGGHFSKEDNSLFLSKLIEKKPKLLATNIKFSSTEYKLFLSESYHIEKINI